MAGNNPDKVSGTFLGRKLSQTPKAIWLWEQVLTKYNFKRIIDIGTWRGNLSFYLYLFCLARDAEFHTFDVREKWQFDYPDLKKELGFPSHFYGMDIFKNIEKIKEFIQKEGITILYCDDGEKTREFNTFAPFLKTGDVIAVHDWKTEVSPESIEKTKTDYGFKEIFVKECDEEGMTRFFEKWK